MKKVKNLDLIIILVAITILGIITAIVLAIRPYEVKKFDKITHVNIDNYKTIKNNKEEYFVLLYDSNNTKYELLEECVVAYAETIRMCQIYM